jgi:hypothetical protein
MSEDIEAHILRKYVRFPYLFTPQNAAFSYENHFFTPVFFIFF